MLWKINFPVDILEARERESGQTDNLVVMSRPLEPCSVKYRMSYVTCFSV